MSSKCICSGKHGDCCGDYQSGCWYKAGSAHMNQQKVEDFWPPKPKPPLGKEKEKP